MREWYEGHGEECPIEIKSYTELEYTQVADINGEPRYVLTTKDYCEYYGITLVAVGREYVTWVDAAYFYIRGEAEKYKESQKHNLTEPRVYTRGLGYGNVGDLVRIRQWLMTMGKQLGGI